MKQSKFNLAKAICTVACLTGGFLAGTMHEIPIFVMGIIAGACVCYQVMTIK